MLFSPIFPTIPHMKNAIFIKFPTIPHMYGNGSFPYTFQR